MTHPKKPKKSTPNRPPWHKNMQFSREKSTLFLKMGIWGGVDLGVDFGSDLIGKRKNPCHKVP